MTKSFFRNTFLNLIVPGCILLLSACCSKVDCSQETFPSVTLYFRDVPAGTPYHTLTVIRLDPSTHAAIDSYSNGYSAYITTFDPWYQYRQTDWQRYSYAFHLEVLGTDDTISSMNYDLHVEKIPCNDCFPLGDGRADIITYQNFSFLNKGRTLHEGDTVFITR